MTAFNAAEAAARDADTLPPVSLNEVAAAALRMREQQHKVQDLEQQLADAKAAYNEMRFRELPDLMSQAQTDRVGVPAVGNHLPPCDLILKPFYKANIEASWEPARREAAFKWLEDEGHGDVISRGVVVAFRKGEKTEAGRLIQMLQAEGYGDRYKVDKSVPWATLTALIKELHGDELAAMARGEDVTPLPLERLGATVGQVAEVKERSQAPRARKER